MTSNVIKAPFPRNVPIDLTEAMRALTAEFDEATAKRYISTVLRQAADVLETEADELQILNRVK